MAKFFQPYQSIKPPKLPKCCDRSRCCNTEILQPGIMRDRQDANPLCPRCRTWPTCRKLECHRGSKSSRRKCGTRPLPLVQERMRHYGAQEHLVVNVTRPLDRTQRRVQRRVGSMSSSFNYETYIDPLASGLVWGYPKARTSLGS